MRVRHGKNAMKILKALEKKKMIPKDIAKEAGMDRSNVSTKLAWLRERGLVKCLNEGDVVFRLYEITDYGKKVLSQAEKMMNEED